MTGDRVEAMRYLKCREMGKTGVKWITCASRRESYLSILLAFYS